MAHSITIRFLTDFPIVVNGGITKWRITCELVGKGGKRYELLAMCLNDQGQGTIVISRGREAAFHSLMDLGFSADKGTLLAKIFSKLVRDGRAELVQRARPWSPP